ncbi:ligand-gated channel [Thalassotalea insulae]|uniref:Ligand-gated channel n=1 Tax=Thalassotalea insulae TaxID=2056778 RepID=A0ABQ6GVZ7_9GAMM|nr:TonB-dependent receptor [Thalassotalea insulae]GLX78841.1 ligand-gated channel [Thalassotalea insulae]
MSFSVKPCALAVRLVTLALVSHSVIAFADDAPEPEMDFEVITITHQRLHGLDSYQEYAQGKTSEPDLANWLMSVPGANVNGNGPITGIAQYRGLYGDRIATTLDGHPVIGAGPNAMDTPLSYSTPLIVDSMTVYRGITPVSAGVDTLAGSVAVHMRKAEVMSQNQLAVVGDIQAGYRTNNSADTLSSVINLSRNDLGLMLYGNMQSGNDIDSGAGLKVRPTEFQKRQFGGDIRFNKNSSELGFSYHYTDTQDSGTPALPMDIEYIFSHRASIDGKFALAQWQGEWTIGFVDADHGMTNFLMRSNDEPMKHRRNNAKAKTIDFSFALSRTLLFGEFELGFDGYLAKHDSAITNPNNTMFKVVNFNGVEDDRIGLYAQWQQAYGATSVQLGARIKHIAADADPVATSMAMMSMPSMAELAIDLRDDFNHGERAVSDTLFDFAFNVDHQVSQTLSVNLGLGVKTRAPSYQERYLWTPMESTGGLADGNTYIGNINLKEETAYQVDLGLNYHSADFSIAPHVFYQNIDDYIQGTSLSISDMSARMMAKMMAEDDNPLKFTNVDAKLSGVDVNWRYQLNKQFSLSGVASYVRGQRRDISDNLYRVAPLNGHLTASYSAENWLINATVVAATEQDKVASTNDEQQTPGYAIANLDLQYFINSALTLRVGVDNIFDKNYQRHLGGYNRVKETDITVMSRLPAEGVSAWAEVTYSF